MTQVLFHKARISRCYTSAEAILPSFSALFNCKHLKVKIKSLTKLFFNKIFENKHTKAQSNLALSTNALHCLNQANSNHMRKFHFLPLFLNFSLRRKMSAENSITTSSRR